MTEKSLPLDLREIFFKWIVKYRLHRYYSHMISENNYEDIIVWQNINSLKKKKNPGIKTLLNNVHILYHNNLVCFYIISCEYFTRTRRGTNSLTLTLKWLLQLKVNK